MKTPERILKSEFGSSEAGCHDIQRFSKTDRMNCFGCVIRDKMWKGQDEASCYFCTRKQFLKLEEVKGHVHVYSSSTKDRVLKQPTSLNLLRLAVFPMRSPR